MRYLLPLALLLSFTCCKKVKENLQKEAALDFITSGQWRVSRFLKDDSALTKEFLPYRFQFHDNFTVDALKNSATELSGTWTGDPAAQTITSRFNTTDRPLVLLNGAWKINRSTSTLVEASQAHTEFTFHIRLEKL